MKKIIRLLCVILILHIIEVLVIYFAVTFERLIIGQDISFVFSRRDLSQVVMAFCIRFLLSFLPQMFIFIMGFYLINNNKILANCNVLKLVIVNLVSQLIVIPCLFLSLKMSDFMFTKLFYYPLIASILSPIILSIFPFFRTMVSKLNESW